jgi:hypothetical protein
MYELYDLELMVKKFKSGWKIKLFEFRTLELLDPKVQDMSFFVWIHSYQSERSVTNN